VIRIKHRTLATERTQCTVAQFPLFDSGHFQSSAGLRRGGTLAKSALYISEACRSIFAILSVAIRSGPGGSLLAFSNARAALAPQSLVSLEGCAEDASLIFSYLGGCESPRSQAPRASDWHATNIAGTPVRRRV
jgi:hypothetical protein